MKMASGNNNKSFRIDDLLKDEQEENMLGRGSRDGSAVGGPTLQEAKTDKTDPRVGVEGDSQVLSRPLDFSRSRQVEESASDKYTPQLEELQPRMALNVSNTADTMLVCHHPQYPMAMPAHSGGMGSHSIQYVGSEMERKQDPFHHHPHHHHHQSHDQALLPYGFDVHRMNPTRTNFMRQHQVAPSAALMMPAYQAMQGGMFTPAPYELALGHFSGMGHLSVAAPGGNLADGVYERMGCSNERVHYSLFPFARHSYSSQCKRKGGQIRFNNAQTNQLEKAFLQRKYLSATDRKKLAQTLGLSDRQVKTWFQNRRAKLRKCSGGAGAEGEMVESPQNQHHESFQYDRAPFGSPDSVDA